jgi:hypothetical protein
MPTVSLLEPSSGVSDPVFGVTADRDAATGQLSLTLRANEGIHTHDKCRSVAVQVPDRDRLSNLGPGGAADEHVAELRDAVRGVQQSCP